MAEFIQAADAQRIEQAIRAAESRTRAELVAVVAPASDSYRYVALALAAILGLAAPFPWTFGLIEGGAPFAHAAALGTAFLVLLLAQVDAARRLITPRGLMHRRAARNARAQFYEQRVRMTRDRAGVLLFVSAFEHHVEIIADENAAKTVPAEVWQSAVDAFVREVKAGDATAGFLAAIDILDDALAAHLPGDAADQDELPNRLIIL